MSDFIPSIDDPVALPRTSVPAGDFSYEADIAPLQRRFFQGVESNPFTSEAQKSDAVFGLADNLNKIVGERQKLRTQEQMMRMREMQYQSTMLHFETTRSKFKEERDMLASLPEITAQLDSIANDPNRDRLQKKRDLSRWGIQHAGTLAKNPGAKIAYASAQDGVDAKGEDPVAFAANVVRLGLNPSSPEVAKMPGASPLAISLAQQAYAAEQSTLKTKRAMEIAKQRNIGLAKALDNMLEVKFQDPDEYEDGSDANRDTFKDAKSRAIVDTIAMFADARERQQLANVKLTDRQRFNIASDIRLRLMEDLIVDHDTRARTNPTLRAFGAQ